MDLIGLIPSFGGIAFTIGAFVLALSIIVAVHEYGHYIVGRWSGIKAEVFSIGFGPVLLSRYDKHGTRWQIAALPLGGYVRFKGDANAASAGSDEAAMSTLSDEERRQTMHGAPLWARSATVFAGPAFNFILSFVVFAAILAFRGVASDPLTIDEITPLPDEYGLQAGDQILAINGRDAPAIEDFGDFVDTLPELSALDYDVRRDGTRLTVSGPFPYPPLVNSITPTSAAVDAGIEVGDVIQAIDGVGVVSFNQLREIVGNSDGQTMTLEVWRSGETIDITLTPRRMDLPLQEGGFETRWLIGISGGLFFDPASEAPSFLEAVEYGVDQTIFIIRSSLSGMYHMAVGAISTCNLQGPIGIAETSGQAASAGWLSFVYFIAVLSTAVGLLNLFPVPVLDGGHLVFHAWEAITGRPPSEKALGAAVTVGIGLMALLMVFALSNDLFCP